MVGIASLLMAYLFFQPIQSTLNRTLGQWQTLTKSCFVTR
jgi:hypothetical protein